MYRFMNKLYNQKPSCYLAVQISQQRPQSWIWISLKENLVVWNIYNQEEMRQLLQVAIFMFSPSIKMSLLIPQRTDRQCADAIAALNSKSTVNGIKGPSFLLALQSYSFVQLLRKCTVFSWVLPKYCQTYGFHLPILLKHSAFIPRLHFCWCPSLGN